MNTPNPSLRPVRRVYWLTPAGSRLARYLDYVESTPTVSADIAFADTRIPEQHDEDDYGDHSPEED